MYRTLTILTALVALSSLILATTASAQGGPTDDDEVTCSYDAYNCSDFTSCGEVLKVFAACKSDVHRLDRDDDGVPCEALCD